jgi:hypothetical protein
MIIYVYVFIKCIYIYMVRRIFSDNSLRQKTADIQKPRDESPKVSKWEPLSQMCPMRPHGCDPVVWAALIKIAT